MRPLVDLHCHTISSGHAFSTLKENIDEAKLKGLKVLGISDHAVSMPGTAHEFYFSNLGVINREINGVRILKGIEANIMDYEGNIDVSKDLCEKLDYVIASLHPPCIKPSSLEDNTRAVIKAIRNPYVKIIGHPDDSRYPLDYKKVVQAAKENNVLIELNNSSLKTQSFRQNAKENYITILNLCREQRVKIILSSDAHIYYEVGEFSYALSLLEEVNFPESLVANYYPEWSLFQ
ncbi:putative hydrolase [Clostridium amylolyticum]|uniref:Putative hydrolase n=1 Tax=Clostridium amylolyticum TaxID=1121298 RepID=A0A1M6GKR5_9CLOT|nr:phosphatase [Clostridium amylolyticum]SHJ10515.1 putative hydrolase [Clostridium amylolyticum]